MNEDVMLAQSRAPRPSVGRAVHYVAYGTPGGEFPEGVCRAATVTEVEPVVGSEDDFLVKLAIFNPTGLFFSGLLEQDEVTKRPGTWHWQERV